MSRIYNFRR